MGETCIAPGSSVEFHPGCNEIVRNCLFLELLPALLKILMVLPGVRSPHCLVLLPRKETGRVLQSGLTATETRGTVYARRPADRWPVIVD